MANPEHIRLLPFVDEWNKSRLAQDFQPDLSDVDLHEEFVKNGLRSHPERRLWLPDVNLSGANLRGTKLEQVNFQSANLEEADLTHADLTGGVLYETNLKGAKLLGAKLNGANLGSSDLTGANLVGANLTDAIFIKSKLAGSRLEGATLDGANFEYTDLTGVDFTGSQAWKAKFHPGNLAVVEQEEISSHTINTVGDLLEIIKEIADLNAGYPLYFRGEPEIYSKLRASLSRPDDSSDRLHIYEGDMLRDLISRRPENFTGMTSALEQWVLARHHGLRTRFLDITKNPLASLFFASEATSQEKQGDGRLLIFAIPKVLIKSFDSDAISIIANFAKLSKRAQDRILSRIDQVDPQLRPEGYFTDMNELYQLIRQEKPYFDARINVGDLYRVYVVEPQQSSERLRAQSGALLVSAFYERFERDEIRKTNEHIPIYAHYRLTIPYDDKQKIIEELEMLGVSRETLFPGLDESASATMRHYRRWDGQPE